MEPCGGCRRAVASVAQHLTVLPQTPVARAEAQFSVAVFLPSSADCDSSHPYADASGESRGTRRARPLLVLPRCCCSPCDRRPTPCRCCEADLVTTRERREPMGPIKARTALIIIVTAAV